MIFFKVDTHMENNHHIFKIFVIAETDRARDVCLLSLLYHCHYLSIKTLS